MKKVVALFCMAIFLSGCAGDVAGDVIEMFQISEPARITKTVLEYWRKGDYESPKKFWNKYSMVDYAYLSDIDSYKIIRENKLAYFNRLTVQIKFRAKDGAIKKELWLFNFQAISDKWYINLIEEAETHFFFTSLPKGKTKMSAPRISLSNPNFSEGGLAPGTINALKIAQQVCKESDWEWEDVSIRDAGDYYSIATKSFQAGGNAIIEIDKQTGKVLKRFISPR
jgi:hypothetical protein